MESSPTLAVCPIVQDALSVALQQRGGMRDILVKSVQREVLVVMTQNIRLLASVGQGQQILPSAPIAVLVPVPAVGILSVLGSLVRLIQLEHQHIEQQTGGQKDQRSVAQQ